MASSKEGRGEALADEGEIKRKWRKRKPEGQPNKRKKNRKVLLGEWFLSVKCLPCQRDGLSLILRIHVKTEWQTLAILSQKGRYTYELSDHDSMHKVGASRSQTKIPAQRETWLCD